MPELSDFTMPIGSLESQAERAENELSAFLHMQDAMPRPYRSDYELERLRDAAQLLDDITYSYLDGLKKAQGIPLWGTPVTVGGRRCIVVDCGVSVLDPTRYNPDMVLLLAKFEHGQDRTYYPLSSLTIAGERIMTHPEQMAWLNG